MDWSKHKLPSLPPDPEAEARRARAEPYMAIERMVDEALAEATEAAHAKLRALGAPTHLVIGLVSDLRGVGEVWKRGISAGGRAMIDYSSEAKK